MTNPLLNKPVDYLSAILNGDSNANLDMAVDTLIGANAIPQWAVFDEDDPDTFPDGGRWGDNSVLAMNIVTKLNRQKADGSPALFYEAHFGQYVICDDGVVRFLLDSGNGYPDEPGDEGEDWIDPPRLWTYLLRPDQAVIDL